MYNKKRRFYINSKRLPIIYEPFKSLRKLNKRNKLRNTKSIYTERNSTYKSRINLEIPCKIINKGITLNPSYYFISKGEETERNKKLFLVLNNSGIS